MEFGEKIHGTNMIPLYFKMVNDIKYIVWRCSNCRSEFMIEYSKFEIKAIYSKNLRRKICIKCIYNVIKPGDTYGNIEVIELIRHHDNHLYWKYKCKCGRYGLSRAHGLLKSLLNGKANKLSCGRCGTQLTSDVHYVRARSLFGRCNLRNHDDYPRYGGRGIKCLLGDNVQDVIRSISKVPGYKEGLQLDRIDNDGHYTIEHPIHGNKIWIDEYGHQCLGNLRWVNPRINSSNRRGSVTLESLASKPRPYYQFKKIISKERSIRLKWNESDFIKEFHSVKPKGNVHETLYIYIHKSLLQNDINK